MTNSFTADNRLVLLDSGGLIMIPVDDLSAAVIFYHNRLGLDIRFRDGDRFCVLNGNGLTIALAAMKERVTNTTVAAFKVENLEIAVDLLKKEGMKFVGGIELGPHESRAVVIDPCGNELVIFSASL